MHCSQILLVEVAAAFNFAKKRSIYSIPLRFILIHFTIMDLLSPLRKIGNGLVGRAQGNESFIHRSRSFVNYFQNYLDSLFEEGGVAIRIGLKEAKRPR